MANFLRLTLVTNETRHVAIGEADAGNALTLFQKSRPPFDGDWIETTQFTAVARAHVVEVQIVDRDA